jgi:hypothetical protein
MWKADPQTQARLWGVMWQDLQESAVLVAKHTEVISQLYLTRSLERHVRRGMYDRFTHESRTGRGKVPLEVGQSQNCLGRALSFVLGHAAIFAAVQKPVAAVLCTRGNGDSQADPIPLKLLIARTSARVGRRLHCTLSGLIL